MDDSQADPPFYYYDPDAPKPPKPPPARWAWSIRSTRANVGCLGCFIPFFFVFTMVPFVLLIPSARDLITNIYGVLFFICLCLHRPAAYLLTMRLVTHLRCPDCGHQPLAWDAWECGCGFKSRQIRHAMDKCDRCGGWVSFVDCERCGSSIEVWGDPPHEKKEGTWVGRTASASST